MKKVLFMIPNLGHGGAEKVLVNLVNHMDQNKFQITVMTLYDEGVNKQFLNEGIIYKSCMKKSFKGVSHVLKLWSPKALYHRYVKEHYDYVISYLEGQTARIVSGCDDPETKKLCWIHRTYTSREDASRLFRNEKEAEKCYCSFDYVVAVSEDVKNAFCSLFPVIDKSTVVYNTNETEKIIQAADVPVTDVTISNDVFNLCGMGSLIPVKGFERLIEVHHLLKEEGYKLHTYILGEGPEKKHLEEVIEKYGLTYEVSLLGYQKNPYHYMKKCQLFVCSSYSEGLSTAVTEALVLGIPVVTTRVSGMKELLGENNEFGIITENNTENHAEGIRSILKDQKLLEYYRKQSTVRGKKFVTEETVKEVEELLESMNK